MDPAFSVALAFLPFALSHIGLAVPCLRSALVARLGVWGFTSLFFVVAALTFGLAISTFAALHGTGAPGPALGEIALLRPVLVLAIVVGIALMAGSLGEYRRTPYSMTNPGVPEPKGLARVSRHPFFFGLGLLGGAHALLATHVTDAVGMGALGAFALVGAHFQDRKLVVQRGDDYADYVRITSTVPFAAIVAGRQRFVLRELPFAGLGIGLAVAWGLRLAHANIFDHAGVYVIGATVGSALLIVIQEWRRERRREQRLATAVAPG